LVVAVFTPPAKVPLAPVCAGAVNVTVTPLVGVPPVVTVATSNAVNAVLTVALCGVPLVAAIETTLGVELELPQAVKKAKARKIIARMLA
jgi:orotate phosphoribosyltransferase-like protein